MIWERLGRDLEESWESLGIALGDLWESFGKIYLNTCIKMRYYRKLIEIFKNFLRNIKKGR